MAAVKSSMIVSRSWTLFCRQLLNKTPGMARRSPATVVRRAPAMPGAMAWMSGRPPFMTMPTKVAMTPQTVPRSPRRGARVMMVAMLWRSSSRAAVCRLASLSMATWMLSISWGESGLGRVPSEKSAYRSCGVGWSRFWRVLAATFARHTRGPVVWRSRSSSPRI